MKINPIRGFNQFPKPNKGVMCMVALGIASVGGSVLISRKDKKKCH